MNKIHNSLVVASGAGGVGRTALATTLSAVWAAEHGLRVLLVDAAPQANATLAMGLNPADHNHGRDFTDAVAGGYGPRVVKVRERLDMVAAGRGLNCLEAPLASDPERAASFAAAFNAIEHRYDRIVFDLPRAKMSSISTVALRVGECLVAPTTDHPQGLEGLRGLGDAVEECGSDIVVLGVVLYNVSVGALRARREALQEIRKILGGSAEPFNTIVRSASAAYAQALQRRQLIHEYAKWAGAISVQRRIRDRISVPGNLAKVANEFEQLATEINDRIADVEFHFLASRSHSLQVE